MSEVKSVSEAEGLGRVLVEAFENGWELLGMAEYWSGLDGWTFEHAEDQVPATFTCRAEKFIALRDVRVLAEVVSEGRRWRLVADPLD